MKNRGTGPRRADGLSCHLVPRYRNMRAHGRSVDRPRHRTGNDYFLGRSGHGRPSRATRILSPGSWRPGTAVISPVRADEVTYLREDLFTPAPAIEDAEVAYFELQMIFSLPGRYSAAEIESGVGLADRANIIFLALDAKQRCPRDRPRLDLAVAGEEPVGGQRMLLEDPFHRLEVEVRGQG